MAPKVKWRVDYYNEVITKTENKPSSDCSDEGLFCRNLRESNRDRMLSNNHLSIIALERLMWINPYLCSENEIDDYF